MNGIHTALVTPFTPDGDLDLPALEALCARQLSAGIHGLVACGTTGETPTLTPAEWEIAVSTCVRAVAGRVPVTAGVGTNDTASTVRNVERAANLGVQAGLLVFPYYNKPNPDGLRAHVERAAAVGLPLVLYHVPGRTGQRVAPELVAELCGIDGVIAVKEATGDLRYGGDLISRTTTPVLSGDDFTFLGLLAQGGTGCVSVVSNVAPALTVEVYHAFRAGRNADAAAHLRRMWPLITFLFSDSNPVPCKAALAALHLCSPHVRLPLATYDGPAPTEILHGVLG